MPQLLKKIMIVLISLLVALVVATLLFMQQSKFGNNPKGKELTHIQQSPNYKNGQFKNLNHTPALAEGKTTLGIMYDFLFTKYPRKVPVQPLPSVKTNLKELPVDSNVLVWFGHSSYYLQLDGLRILVDPVFSGNASPVPGSVKAFAGTDRYTAEDLPAIDFLFISHDHYDHLDYKTIVALKGKISHVVCGLGVGSHFKKWGYPEAIITEKDWGGQVELAPNLTAFVTPARHFSGRGFTRNKTLWTSYVLDAPSLKIFLGGDSGYDTHYKKIGATHGPFDLAILENGQYDAAWPYIHHQPSEVLQAAEDLGAKRIFPVHSGKFPLANHPWDEPLKKITSSNKNIQIPLVTPLIGELVNLNAPKEKYAPWWVGLD